MDTACNPLKADAVSECISQTNLTFSFRSSWGQTPNVFCQDVKHVSVLVTVVTSSLAQPGTEPPANSYIYKM